jgi:3-isopropylmalate/(R)-2-methylmalate dehydratase small subunit
MSTDHRYVGKAWVFGDNINTDLMYPHICYTVSENERPRYTMWANRPGWAEMVQAGDILVAGRNFGMGSSRPAAANLKGLGISCVIAESVNGLFLRNSVNFGLPIATVPGIRSSVSEGDRISVDLDRGAVTAATGEVINFKPLPLFLLEILDSGGIIEVLKKKGLLDLSPFWD